MVLRLFLTMSATTFLLMALSATVMGADVKADYLFSLSDFTGVVPYTWGRLAVDRQRNEVYVTNSSDLSVRIFNSAGMQLYTFGEDGGLGYIKDLALGENGEMFVLSGSGREYKVIRADFRGESQGNIAFSGIPPAFSSGFAPDNIIYRGGILYLVDKYSMKVLVTDQQGIYKTEYDIGALLKLTEKQKAESGIVGFSVDREGDLLFTIPVTFRAYVVSPDKKIRSFGANGSSPGKFNVVGGIVADEKGYLYVVDTLRCVVMIFEKSNFTFKGEFGYRGFEPGNLIAPMDVATMNDKIYVTQSMNRGVNVYRIVVE